MHNLPLEQRISRLMDFAREKSAEYSSPDAQLARRRHAAKHPTTIISLACMDGRVNVPLATRTPSGVISTYRNLGGKFDLGWFQLGDNLQKSVYDSLSKGQRVLALVTYHFSKGSVHRGCAGFAYDTEAAKEHTLYLQNQFDEMFGAGRHTVFPLLVGFETDEDALILHGTNGRLLKVAELTAADRPTVRGRLDVLFPDMPAQIRDDLMPLILGNMDHIAEVRSMGAVRNLDIEHREWTLAVGGGLDWLQIPNVALMIGPYSPDLSTPIKTAAKIIAGNMSAGRIRNDGFALLASAPFEDVGMDKARAVLRAKFIRDFAWQVVKEAEPELAGGMQAIAVIVDVRTRGLEIVPEENLEVPL